MKSTLFLITLMAMSAITYGHRPEVNITLDWWQKNILYQVYPRSYKDSDNNGTGDLKGITQKLDHIKSLGPAITIWLNPIFKSPMADFGYDVSDYMEIDPIFGTLADFQSLLKAAHDKGMKVVLDYIPNHTSDQHNWFNQSRYRVEPYTDYYVWKDGKDNNTKPPNNWLSVFGNSSWTFDDTRQQYYLHQFLKEQPDLNYRNSLVHQEIFDIWKYWLDMGVDGFRQDAHIFIYESADFLDEPLSHTTSDTTAYDYLDHIYTKCQPEMYDLLAEWRKFLDNHTAGEHRFMMVENYCSVENAMSYYGNESHRLADFPINFQLQNLTSGVDSPKSVYEIINTWLNALPLWAWSNWILGSHDVRRVGTRMTPAMIDGLNMINLLIGGTPTVYYGEELGMEDNFNITYDQCRDTQACNYGPELYLNYSRDPARTPYQWDSSVGTGFTGDSVTPWLPIHANHITLNVQDEEKDDRSHLNTFKKLLNYRSNDSIMYGSVDFPLITDKVFSFLRVKSGSKGYAVVVNFVSESLTANIQKTTPPCCDGFSLPDEGSVVVRNDKSSRKELETLKLGEISLTGYEALLIEFVPVHGGGAILSLTLSTLIFCLVILFSLQNRM